ncbi:hypothetical protein FKP32DRAFT_1604887 [Trametes sanguinea]|nr:hypothetical protein FKP32DRAFT_1604887 [Trametes sanguinea]
MVSTGWRTACSVIVIIVGAALLTFGVYVWRRQKMARRATAVPEMRQRFMSSYANDPESHMPLLYSASRNPPVPPKTQPTSRQSDRLPEVDEWGFRLRPSPPRRVPVPPMPELSESDMRDKETSALAHHEPSDVEAAISMPEPSVVHNLFQAPSFLSFPRVQFSRQNTRLGRLPSLKVQFVRESSRVVSSPVQGLPDKRASLPQSDSSGPSTLSRPFATMANSPLPPLEPVSPISITRSSPSLEPIKSERSDSIQSIGHNLFTRKGSGEDGSYQGFSRNSSQQSRLQTGAVARGNGSASSGSSSGASGSGLRRATTWTPNVLASYSPWKGVVGEGWTEPEQPQHEHPPQLQPGQGGQQPVASPPPSSPTGQIRVADAYRPMPTYWPHALVAATVLAVIYAYAQGRQTTRERDLHARVILLTGPFTPLGLVTLTALAKRGAHIIALSPYPLSHPVPSLILSLLRSTTKNENIFAEHCDLHSPTSIRKFCTSFLTGNETRLDALVFAHEYPSIGRIWFFGGRARRDKEEREEQEREAASLASFLLTTMLLPALLVAPVERDIRIVHVVNPFYAAALPAFPSFLNSTPSSPPTVRPLVIAEGLRALRTIALTRHLQRILDSLPNRKADPKSKSAGSSKGAEPPIPQPSNIISVAACPGISRRDTIAPFLGASERNWSLAYFVLFPILLLVTKTSEAALQTLLHVLFLPTPFKRAQAKIDAAADEERKAEAEAARAASEPLSEQKTMRPRTANVEVVKPGGLYRECAVVPLNIPRPPLSALGEDKGKKKGKASEAAVQLEDDGEYGGEAVGRAVWEWYEARLKDWEARDAERVKAEEEAAKAEKENVPEGSPSTETKSADASATVEGETATTATPL